MGKILRTIMIMSVILSLGLLMGCSVRESMHNNENSSNSESTEENGTSPFINQSRQDVIFNNKVNIYFFYGEGCEHCNDLAGFFDEIDDEYGTYYNLYTFEVWNDQDNKAYMQEFQDRLNWNAAGVPFFVIEDTPLEGYSDATKKEIMNLILEKYNEKLEKSQNMTQ